jgi:type III secretion system YscQ/HrcQ family protein
VSLDPLNLATRPTPATGARPAPGDGPMGELPQLSYRQVRLAQRLSRFQSGPRLGALRAWLTDALRTSLDLSQAEILHRASGLTRPGVVAHLTWPRLASRLALGIETPLVHAVVDRLLGFDRLPAEHRLQVSPVEWGILSFVLAESLDRLGDRPSALGPWDFLLERVAPDAFNPSGLGPILTLRWAVQVGETGGSIRLWIPESLVALELADELAQPPISSSEAKELADRFADLTGSWRAVAGAVSLPRGLGRLRVGGVLPIDGNRLGGTPQSPVGPVELELIDRDGRSWFPAEATPGTGGRRLSLTAPIQRQRLPREALPVNPSQDTSNTSPTDPSPTDVPVTLVVELGRINLPLRRLADLKPGDVLELGRHAKEPVELTSGGRLIARGELVQIDTELGIRVTNVFL